jgi:hypothetical protein
MPLRPTTSELESLPSELWVLAMHGNQRNLRSAPTWPVEEQNWEPMVAVANPFVSGLLSVPPTVLLFDVSTAALPAASSAPWLWSKRVGANLSIQLHTVGMNNQLSDLFKIFLSTRLNV